MADALAVVMIFLQPHSPEELAEWLKDAPHVFALEVLWQIAHEQLDATLWQGVLRSPPRGTE